MENTNTTKCIAVRSVTHGKWIYRAAYVYEVVNGKWQKGEQLLEMSSGAKTFMPKVLAIAAARGLTMRSEIVHGMKYVGVEVK